MFYCVSPQYWMNSPRYQTKYINLKKLQNFIIYDKMPVGLNEAKLRVIYLRKYKLSIQAYVSKENLKSFINW